MEKLYTNNTDSKDISVCIRVLDCIYRCKSAVPPWSTVMMFKYRTLSEINLWGDEKNGPSWFRCSSCDTPTEHGPLGDPPGLDKH